MRITRGFTSNAACVCECLLLVPMGGWVVLSALLLMESKIIIFPRLIILGLDDVPLSLEGLEGVCRRET